MKPDCTPRERRRPLTRLVPEYMRTSQSSRTIDTLNSHTTYIYFYIEEGERLKINNLVYDFEDDDLSKSITQLSLQLEKEVNKNNFYFFVHIAIFIPIEQFLISLVGTI